MEEGQPSGTAVFAAVMRAAHLIMDDEPKILQDDFALGFSGMRNEDELDAALVAFHREFGEKSTPMIAQSLLQSFRGFTVIRHRYTEDELAKALERGVSQYVILGAGLDSFAYRKRDLEDKLRVFEVGYPATQQWKKTRLQELNIPFPHNLTFVPINFEKQTLMDELRTHGYQENVSTFFSWLGVTLYLSESAVLQTLQAVASEASGSEIVFDYSLPESLLGDGERQILALGQANPSEPVLTLFAPDSLAERLKEIGFSESRDFGPEEANTLYIIDRTDDLSAFVLNGLIASTMKLFHIMKARV